MSAWRVMDFWHAGRAHIASLFLSLSPNTAKFLLQFAHAVAHWKIELFTQSLVSLNERLLFLQGENQSQNRMKENCCLEWFFLASYTEDCLHISPGQLGKASVQKWPRTKIQRNVFQCHANGSQVSALVDSLAPKPCHWQTILFFD